MISFLFLFLPINMELAGRLFRLMDEWKGAIAKPMRLGMVIRHIAKR